MDILTLAVKVREVGKHANVFVDVEGRQHVPAVSTRPMAGGAFGELADVPAPY
jgi:hypothetical protein